MARLIVEGQELVVGLSWLEKLGALRGNVRVPPPSAAPPGSEPAPTPAIT
jgi:hypothetical protein